MEDNEATGVRLSWQVLLTGVVLLTAAGAATATIQIQVATLGREVAKYGTDIQEYRAEVRAMSAKLDRYIEVLVETRTAPPTSPRGIREGRSTTTFESGTTRTRTP